MFVTHSAGVWTVPLRTHAAYPAAELQPRFPDLEAYPVVIVDTARLIACFARDSGFFIRSPEHWPATKLAGLRDYLDPAKCHSQMPFAHCEEREFVTPRWFGLRSPLRHTLPVVGFTDGRHRTRYLEHAGAAAIPLQVEARNAALMLKHCGFRA